MVQTVCVVVALLNVVVCQAGRSYRVFASRVREAMPRVEDTYWCVVVDDGEEQRHACIHDDSYDEDGSEEGETLVSPAALTELRQLTSEYRRLLYHALRLAFFRLPLHLRLLFAFPRPMPRLKTQKQLSLSHLKQHTLCPASLPLSSFRRLRDTSTRPIGRSPLQSASTSGRSGAGSGDKTVGAHRKGSKPSVLRTARTSLFACSAAAPPCAVRL